MDLPRSSLVFASLFCLCAPLWSAPLDPAQVLKSAKVLWAGEGPDSTDGAVQGQFKGTVRAGVVLAGTEQAASLASGGDGIVADFDGGQLLSKPESDRRLVFTGNALTVLLRYRAESMGGAGIFFSKHGGHDKTVFNFHVVRGELGFEFGVQENSRLAARLTLPVDRAVDGGWHVLAARYDGSELVLFFDGQAVGREPVTGTLRTNEVPLVIGKILRGQIDHAALWNRALSDAEIAVLSGRSAPVAAVNAAPAVKAPAGVGRVEGDRVIADFNGTTYGDWTVEGAAFGQGPVGGVASSASAERNVYGKLTSPDFEIDRRYLNFRVGGDRRGSTIRLYVEGKPVLTTNGLGQDELWWVSWDLAPYLGKTARIEIRDFEQSRTGVFAHIAVDDFRLSDTAVLKTVERDLVMAGNFLNIPVSYGGRPSEFTLEVDGKLYRSGGMVPPQGKQPDYWLAMELPALEGKRLHLRVEDAPHESSVLNMAYVSPRPHDADTLYRERLRPQFHFSPRNGWLNDPNGMVYLDGEYHLFYQLNALGLSIGNQSWGHAVSPDLFHWKELPPVLEPYSFSKGRSYSGSAVIDVQGRAGFGRGAMVAAYTDTGGGAPAHGPEADNQRAEVIAYSTDRGRTFTYFDGNPVFRHPEGADGRDPKILWWPTADTEQVDPQGHWLMVVFSKENGVDKALILTSPDLKTWTQTDTVPDHYECIEFFELPLLTEDGRPTGRSKWVVQGGNGTYHLGDFDGRKFTNYAPEKQRTLQLTGYAYQRFNQAPDGRIITMAWIRRHTDWGDMPFSQMMSLPLELTLRETPAGPRVFANPVKELAAISREIFRREAFGVTPEASFALPGAGQQYDVEVTFKPKPGTPFVIELGNDRIEWADGKLNAKLSLPASADGVVTLRVIVDRPLIEIFGNGGAIYQAVARRDQGRDVAVSLSGDAEILSCSLRQIAGTVTNPFNP